MSNAMWQRDFSDGGIIIMVDFYMDCSETENGWFNVKTHLTNFGELVAYMALAYRSNNG